MRIKLTESQYNKIRLIKESEEAFAKYEKLCSDSIAEINKMYLTIMNSSVSEIVSGSVNVVELERKLEKIDTDIFKAEKEMLRLHGSGLIGQGIEDFDITIEDLASSVSKKYTSLSLILGELVDVRDKEDEYEVTKSFEGVKPMDIQSFE